MLIAILVLLPGVLHAQRIRRQVCCKPNPFSFAPYAGAYKDPFDVSSDGDNTGYMVGFRLGYDLGHRARLVGDVAYAESKDVSSRPVGLTDYNVYDDQWIMTTGGAEYDIIPGGTSVTLGAQTGAGWRKIALDQQVGTTFDDASGGYHAEFVVVPRVSVRHSFTARTALDVSVLDHIFPGDSNVEHGPALTVGFSFR